MFFRRPAFHRFEYQPRFYNPERDRAERLKEKLRAARRQSGAKRKSLLRWIILAALILAAYIALLRVG